jgi:hypothetical protein
VAGRVHYAEVRNGIDGTVVASPDFNAQDVGDTSFNDGTGKTWTINPPASIGTDSGSELPFDGVTLEYDDETLVNLVRIAREGGTQQTAQDATSQTKYLVHTHERTDLLMQTDTAALDYANFVLFQSKDAELRFSELVVNPLRDETNLFPQVLGRDIGDRITVKLTPPGGGSRISRDVFIRGIEHEITPDTWRTRWTLQSATKYDFLVLDHATLGKLDSHALSY